MSGFLSDSPADVAKVRAENSEYASLLRTGDFGLEKASEVHEDQLAHYLRETSAMDKVMPPTPITSAECEVGIDNDTLYKRVYFQPELRTFFSSFESLPTEVQEIFISRIHVGFYVLGTPKVVFNDYNLMAYPFPVVKQVEDLIGPSMHEAIDWVMLDRLEAAIQAANTGGQENIKKGVQAQADIATNGADTGFRGQIEREDILTLRKAYSNSRSKIAIILMTESDFIDMERFKLSDFGDELLGDVFINGLDTETIHGVRVIRTIKSDYSRGDLIRPGNIYAFADPNMMGRSYILQGMRIFMDRDHQFVYLDGHQARGFIWAITSRLFKLELYNGGLNLDNSGKTGSDALWGSPQEVTFKDYVEVEKGYYNPNIIFD